VDVEMSVRWMCAYAGVGDIRRKRYDRVDREDKYSAPGCGESERVAKRRTQSNTQTHTHTHTHTHKYIKTNLAAAKANASRNGASNRARKHKH
jgi:hypothetical protein